VKKIKKICQYVLTFTAKGGNIKSSRKAQTKEESKMTLTKGTIIKEIKRNDNPMMLNTTANRELTYKIVRVNPKTYTLECIEGYMKGSGCFLPKTFKAEHKDVYGTITKWVVVS
jgi:hypothetical protein